MKEGYAINLMFQDNGQPTSTLNVRHHPIILTEVRPSSELHDLLHAIVTEAISRRPQMKSLLFTEVGNVAPLHVSLTRPLILWTTEKEAFLTAFKTAVEEIQYLASVESC